MKETDAYSLSAELKATIIKESSRLGISKSILVETTLANGLRQVIKDFEKTLKRKRK